MSFNKKKVLIIGLGLMGSSLALALKKRFSRIIIYGNSRSPQKIFRAQKKKIIDKGDCDLRALLLKENFDIIIIATPVSVIRRMARVINTHARNHPIVTDLGSTKGELMRWVEKTSLRHIAFVGSHPIAGSHNSGLAAADINLYQGSFCFLTKPRKTPVKALRSIQAMWRQIGVQTILISSHQHDAVVSKVSHLPHVVATLLVDAAAKSGTDVFRYVGPGFLDATRIAQSDASMWIDILISNKRNILKDLSVFRKKVEAFIRMLQKGDEKKLHSLLTKTATKRKKLGCSNAR